MRFLGYESEGVEGVAIVRSDGEYRGLLATDHDFPGTLDQIVRESRFADAAHVLENGTLLDPATITYRPPLSRPGKVLCIGLNYADHARETRMELPSYPTVFTRYPTSYVAHDAPLICPRASGKFDYEAELVAVIGKSGRDITEADALDHVCGYSIFNDGTIRDFQAMTSQWTLGKNFDDTGSFGPFLVTADDLPAGAAGLRISTRLNGQVLQDGNTNDLIFDVRRLVALISASMTLEAGDMLVTGTPAGVGVARNPKVFLKPGDVCEVSVEGIGTLRNPVIAQDR